MRRCVLFSFPLLLILAALAFGPATAQQVGVNTPTPDPSAVMEVKSNSQGFLPPRLTTAARNAIASPATGLMIFNTDTNCMEYWNGSQWISMCGNTAPCTPPTILSATSNSPTCVGQSIQLNATASGATSYLWTGPNGYTSTTQNPTISPAAAANFGTYYVTAAVGTCVSSPSPVVVQTLSTLPTANLVAYYPFSGNANDASTNANNGTVFGATLTTDRYGNTNSAYSFNGTSNYIEAPSIAATNLTGSMSISCWIRINSRASWKSWVSKVNSASDGSQYRFGFGTNATTDWGLTYRVSGTWHDVWTSTNAPATGSWVQVIMVINTANNTVSYYNNGVLAQSISHTFVTTASNNPLWIGRQQDNGIYFDGAIDDVRIFNKALTACEVDLLYNTEKP